MTDRQHMIDICQAYIFKGLQDQTPELVPLADNCLRTELGMITGRNAAHIRELLKGQAYDAVLECYDLNWTVEDNQACVFYKQKLSFTDTPCLVATRFVVADKLISEIEILLFNHGIMDATAEAVTALADS